MIKRMVIQITCLLCPIVMMSQQMDVEGDLKVNGVISGVADPVSAQDAATKAYADAIKNSFQEELLEAGLHGSVTDIDGNTYKTIKIGNQIWMADNLKVNNYNDGTPLPFVSDNFGWTTLTSPAYAWYENDSSTYAHQHGALYNYYVVADTNSMNICPIGWHIPSDPEWEELTDFLENNAYGFGGSGPDIAKAIAATFGWAISMNAGNVGNDTGSNNSSKFSALSSGFRDRDNGSYAAFGSECYWWSSTETFDNKVWLYPLTFSSASFGQLAIDKGFGFSVRCVKD